MEHSKPKRIDRDRRRAVTKLHLAWLRIGVNYLCNHEATHLDSRTCGILRITVLPLEWQPQNSVDAEPRFSRPFDRNHVDSMYQRSRVDGYYKDRESWGRWGDENDEEELECYPQRIVEGNVAAYYVTGIIGYADDALHVAADTDWMMCGGGEERYAELSHDPCFRQPQSLDYLYFYRALPWPQRELPSDRILIERQRRKVQWLSRELWDTVIDESIRRPGQRPKVHLGVVIINDSDPCEDKLLRNEVAVAARAMYDQMRQKRNSRDHLIFPVFVYAFAGKYVRVLQAHLDPAQPRLVIRKTSYIHIAGPESVDSIKLLLSWMTATPIGNTRFDELELEFDLEDLFETDLMDEPRSPKKKATSISQA